MNKRKEETYTRGEEAFYTRLMLRASPRGSWTTLDEEFNINHHGAEQRSDEEAMINEATTRITEGIGRSIRATARGTLYIGRQIGKGINKIIPLYKKG